MTTNLKTTREVQTLIKARELLVKKGWIRGFFHDQDGYCLIGAINSAGRRCNTDKPRGASLLMEAIWGDRAGDRHWTDVFDWNDDHTEQDVLAALDKAIALGMGVKP